MLTIGDFATLGRVSVRMLRHYDSLGLLPPAAVDPHSGYRYYTAAQLGRLNRVIALKDLGLTLAQVRAILDETVDLGELRGMLRLRRAQLAAQLAADTARLSSVEARLHMIETEGRMTNQDVVLKQVPPIRVAELSAVARSYEPADIGPVLTPLYPELFRRLEEAGVNPVGPSVAWYDQAADGESVVVHAGVGIESGTATGGVAWWSCRRSRRRRRSTTARWTRPTAACRCWPAGSRRTTGGRTATRASSTWSTGRRRPTRGSPSCSYRCVGPEPGGDRPSASRPPSIGGGPGAATSPLPDGGHGRR